MSERLSSHPNTGELQSAFNFNRAMKARLISLFCHIFEPENRTHSRVKTKGMLFLKML
jgi:hypothetical protein